MERRSSRAAAVDRIRIVSSPAVEILAITKAKATTTATAKASATTTIPTRRDDVIPSRPRRCRRRGGRGERQAQGWQTVLPAVPEAALPPLPTNQLPRRGALPRPGISPGGPALAVRDDVVVVVAVAVAAAAAGAATASVHDDGATIFAPRDVHVHDNERLLRREARRRFAGRREPPPGRAGRRGGRRPPRRRQILRFDPVRVAPAVVGVRAGGRVAPHGPGGRDDHVPLHGPPQAADVGEEFELRRARGGESRDERPRRLARPLRRGTDILPRRRRRRRRRRWHRRRRRRRRPSLVSHTQESAVVFGRVPLRRHHGVRRHYFSLLFLLVVLTEHAPRSPFPDAHAISLSRVRLKFASRRSFPLSLYFVSRRPRDAQARDPHGHHRLRGRRPRWGRDGPRKARQGGRVGRGARMLRRIGRFGHRGVAGAVRREEAGSGGRRRSRGRWGVHHRVAQWHDALPRIISDFPRDVPGSEEGATVRGRKRDARSEGVRCLEDERRGFEVGRSRRRGEFD